MPKLRKATQLLAEFMSALSHPKRIRIIEELQGDEKDVSSLIKILDISQTAVSQHLSTMKKHGVLVSRREGHHVYYSLKHDELPQWLIDGLDFVEQGAADSMTEVKAAVKLARAAWSSNP